MRKNEDEEDSSIIQPKERIRPPSESPLRVALSAKPSPTPILAASLNAPPINNEDNYHRGMDLSRAGRGGILREEDEESEEGGRGGTYANLLMHLKRPLKKPRNGVHGNCYQCPVCRKRFQRHIAMNAHFQSEHIGDETGGSKEKCCKICREKFGDLGEIRIHLLRVHRIDLENPSACLIAEEKYSSSSSSKNNNSLSSPSSSSPDEESIGSSSSSTDRLLLLQEDSVESRRDLNKIERKRKKSSPSSGILRRTDSPSFPWKCPHCQIIFPNQTLYFLHKGFHSEITDPWRCNGCGISCTDMYDFNTHLMSDPHH